MTFPNSPRRVLALAMGAVIVLSVVVVLGGDVGRAVAPLVACTGATLTLCAKARAEHGRSRAVLIMFACGIGTLAANNVVDLGYALTTPLAAAPSPWTQIFPAISYAFIVAAALAVIWPSLRGDTGGVLDIAMLSIGLSTAIWLGAAHSALTAGGVDRGRGLVLLALMFALVVALAVIIDTGVNRLVDVSAWAPLAYLTATITIGLAGNLAGPALEQSTIVDGTLVQELLWLIGYVSAWAGFAHPDALRAFTVARRMPSTLTRTRVLWLAVAIGIVPLIGTVRHLSGYSADIAVWGAAQVLLVGLAAMRVAQLAMWHRRTELALQQLVHHDDLTGLANRRAVYERLDASVARLEGHLSDGLTVFFIDLDGFKQVNDAYGHAVGDEVLVEVSRRLQDACPEQLVGRVGGDEFVVIAEGEPPSVPAAVEALAAALLADSFDVESGPVNVDVSVGCAVARPGDSASVDELLSRADDAMYAHKRSTRELLSLADDAMYLRKRSSDQAPR